MDYPVPAYLTPFILIGMIVVIACRIARVAFGAPPFGVAGKRSGQSLLERLIAPGGMVCRSRGDVDCWILSTTIRLTPDNSVRHSGSYRSWRAVVSKLAVAPARYRHCSQ